MTWAPGDPWPSDTEGGAAAPRWGGYVRFWLRAGIAPGLAFHMGQHDQDRLDAGNVLGPASSDEGGFLGDRLWVDLTCDATQVEIDGGAQAGQGIFGKMEAVTLTATLADPDGIYDPLFDGGPFTIGGDSRLVPGVPVEAFAEVVTDVDTPAVTRLPIFTGTADQWGQDWTATRSTRRATLIASDQTKVWARYNAPEQPAQGGGDTVGDRIARLVTFYGWPGDVVDPPAPSTRTLAPTTLAQPGWELLNRALDDELGVVFFTPAGDMRWTTREAVIDVADARLKLGCERVDSDAYDVLVDASPERADDQLKNDVWAARAGGTSQHAASASSIEQFGTYGFNRTDLGLASDAQVAQWATFVVQLYAFPIPTVNDVTMLPGVDESSAVLWATVLDWQLLTDVVHVAWAPPDLPDHVITGDLRVVGVAHRITRDEWSVTWQTIAARPLSLAGNAFRMGPAATDRLDSNFVLI